MTREQQVERALRVLAPTRDEREECRADILDALNCIDLDLAAKRFMALSKAQRMAVRSYLRLLERVEHQHGLVSRINSYADEAFQDPDHFIKKQMAAAERFLESRPRPAYRTAYRERAAVREASHLVVRYAHPTRLTRPTKTRGGKWHKLAAILFGNPWANLYRYL